jgi:hypothetical protein
MSDSLPPNTHSRDALDELVKQLLICVGTVSLMINDMLEFAASGRGAPDAPPVDEVAHELIVSVLGPLGARHRGADIEVAATIIEEVVEEICEGIFVVSDELLEAAEE